jgi:hypothetical protein
MTVSTAAQRQAHAAGSAAPLPAAGPVTLLVGTRKGAFLVRSDRARAKWKLEGPILLGNIVYHMVLDPRDRQTLLMAVRTGHLGPTVFRSSDRGHSWQEAAKPPAFSRAPEGEHGLAVNHVFWLSPGHDLEKGLWYAGSSPPGLFRSEDGGNTWESVESFNAHPMRTQWLGGLQDGTPGGPKLHSIRVDPRNPSHIYFGVSSGGVFETTDGGESWNPLNKGCLADFIPIPDPEYGHDPHNLQMHPLKPDRLYQQNHCGIYRMDRAEGVWTRIGTNMPAEVGDIGFPMSLHPRDTETVWVFPMDGTTVWPRTNIGGKPAAYVTRNGGLIWKRQDRGLPKSQTWFNVKRQALACDRHDPVGVYFGTTNGEVYASSDEGEHWTSIIQNLPEVYSVETAEFGR